MSEIKANKTQSTATARKVTAKKKRKQFWKNLDMKKQKFKKTAPPQKRQEKDVAQPIAPPEDPKLFSSNWKALQEVLKATQPEKKHPVTPKHPNGGFTKKASENYSKNKSQQVSAPNQTDTEKKVKHKTGVNLKAPAASDTQQPVGPKRKKEGQESNHEHAAKKKKSPVVEEKKLTEDDLWFDDVDPDDIEETMGAEAADIMRRKQGIQKNTHTETSLVKKNAFEGLTRAVAVDCEMVGVGPGGEDSIVARVSMVNQFGKCIYDKYVKPTEKVTDYRTAVSGIRPKDIKDGEDVRTVQREVAEILQGRVVVGHAIHNDLKILLLDHPKKQIRDTQKYKPFKRIVGSGRPSLKVLCREILNVKVQQGEHSSVQDAQATMRLYTLVKKQWEAEIKAGKINKDSDKKSKRKPK
ncbi:unnamed protein product [Menidia menidia]|uniref:RNA exonuclease 4 n=1 Tax=Menidia menidia TaxID=238744 RepID=A0A8S4AVF2_9TELE|nr:unnamed protein product [Menidia menidia]